MKISIVTVAYRAAATLADTLESVARQSHGDVEHLLIDGGSDDATPEVVKRHGVHLARFVSEPDRGLYDAMNKGAGLATGDVLGFLNADDWYASPEVLAWVAAAFEAGADLVYGDLSFVEPKAPYATRRVWTDAQHAPRDFLRRGWQPAHPTTFIRLERFRALGGFDLRYRIGADYAFLARAMADPTLRTHHVANRMINMRLGGASTEGPAAVWRANCECAAALRELGVALPWTVIAMKLARKIPQVVRGRQLALHPDVAGVPVWRPWDASGDSAVFSGARTREPDAPARP